MLLLGGVPGPLSNAVAPVIARQRQLKSVLRQHGTLSLFEYLEMGTINWYVIIVNFFQFLNQNYDLNLCSTTSTR